MSPRIRDPFRAGSLAGDTRWQAQDGVQVAVHHQEAAQLGPRAIAEQNVVRHDNGAAPARFQAADGMFKEGHGPDPFARRQGEVWPIGVGWHLVEGRIGQDYMRLTQHLTLRRTTIFAADKAFDAVQKHVHHAQAAGVGHPFVPTERHAALEAALSRTSRNQMPLSVSTCFR